MICYQVFARKNPFYQYTNEYKILVALIKHHEIPILPATDDPLDTIDDRMWGLMTKCWDYEPENRPSCEDIQRFIAGLRVPNDRFVSPTPTGGNSQAFWKSVKAKSETTINYAHISQILLRVGCNSAIFPCCCPFNRITILR